MNSTQLSIAELQAGYAAGDFSPLEVVAVFAARIEALEPGLGALTTRTLESALREAAEATDRYARGTPVRPLDGIPYVAKDLFDTRGVRTTYGSRIFDAHVPRADAAAVARLRDAGAIMLGKAATHEFGWGVTTVGTRRGPTRNPWAPGRIAGGSSGGSAAALAADFAPLALGTDTAGSIRIPSALCGVVGHKPSRGLVSTAGAFRLARSLDHVGPMARSPADARIALSVLSGERAVSAGAGRRRANAAPALEGVRVGVCTELQDELAVERRADFERALTLARDLGAEVVDISLPEAAGAYETLGTIVLAEGRCHHARLGLWPARRGDYEPDVRRRLELADRLKPSDYAGAMAKRAELEAGFARAFRRVQLIVSPAVAIGPVTIEERGREDLRARMIACAAPQSLAGLPACTIRAGFDDAGLPGAVQLSGPRSADLRVLSAAQAFFEATPGVQERRPQIPLPPLAALRPQAGAERRPPQAGPGSTPPPTARER